MPTKPVAIVGLGYVGLPLAILAQNHDYDVVGVEYDARKTAMIAAGRSPFIDEGVSAWLSANQLKVSNSFDVIKDAGTIVLCVPTPVDENYTPDLTPVTASCQQIAGRLQPGQLVIVESTINPGVCDEVIIPLLERESGLKCGRDFYLAHCPERINPGDPQWHVGNIARVVGGYDAKSLELAVAFYRSIVDAPIKPMGSLKEAEAVKVVENSFRDVNIAFVNELAMSFTKLGIDVVNVIEGSATKPFGFMPFYPGAGVGGHCIPVDPYYLIEYARSNGFEHKFLATARAINNGMPAFTVDQLESGLAEAGQSLKGAKVAVLGLSYKAGVGDLRESPSLQIIKTLQERGAAVVAHDPYISKHRGVERSFVADPEPVFFERFSGLVHQEIIQAMTGADAVVIATAHSEYKALTPSDFELTGAKVVIDGRNCLDKAEFTSEGIIYKGIGR